MPDVRLQLLAVLLMAAATYATRVTGLILMGVFRPTPRLESLLRHLSGSVLAALAAPATFHGDTATVLGVGSALAVMIVLRQSLLALITGIGAAILFRSSQ